MIGTSCQRPAAGFPRPAATAPAPGRPAAGSRQPAAGAAGTEEEARLRAAARQLEGVFVLEMFKAMRATVPDAGVVDGGSGEEIFTGMLDEHLAAQVPGEWQGGLGEALFRELRGRLAAADDSVAAPAGILGSGET